jgi:crotonobetainyl-CoA:carnitine CoA-transferase CaiB-like acyl-CoA transferase
LDSPVLVSIPPAAAKPRIFPYSGAAARPATQAATRAFTGMCRLKSTPLCSKIAVGDPRQPNATELAGILARAAARRAVDTMITTAASSGVVYRSLRTPPQGVPGRAA